MAVAAWACDIYKRLNQNLPPKMPKIVNTLIKLVNDHQHLLELHFISFNDLGFADST